MLNAKPPRGRYYHFISGQVFWSHRDLLFSKARYPACAHSQAGHHRSTVFRGRRRCTARQCGWLITQNTRTHTAPCRTPRAHFRSSRLGPVLMLTRQWNSFMALHCFMRPRYFFFPVNNLQDKQQVITMLFPRPRPGSATIVVYSILGFAWEPKSSTNKQTKVPQMSHSFSILIWALTLVALN